MSVTRYKLWAWGESVGAGAMGSRHVGVAGIAKPTAKSHPYCLANEVICNSLARVLRLPVPPGFIVEKDGTPYYVSLNFNLSGEDLPPADAAAIVDEHPRLAWGILLFDVWIVNGDRHRKNIAYDKRQDAVQIFDHSHAFMKGTNGRGHLEANKDNLGIASKHCLAKEIETSNGLSWWEDRIAEVPEYYIRDVVSSTTDLGLPEKDEDFCVQFLLNRRDRVRELVENNRDSFAKLEPDLLAKDTKKEEAADAPETEEEGDPNE